MELAGIFTQRPPESVQPADSQSKVFPIKDGERKDQIDVSDSVRWVCLDCRSKVHTLQAVYPQIASILMPKSPSILI